NNNNNNNKNNNNAGAGNQNAGDAAERGQAFCQAQFPNLALADGSQNRNGACSLTVQGAIPSFNNMVSTIIVSPANGAQIPINQDFEIVVRTLNMELGVFDNPQTAYYQTPQTLNNQGIIRGHQHVVIQSMGNNANPNEPLDPRNFEFFRGLDFEPSGGNTLTLTVPAGTVRTRGFARLSTLTGTAGHQPVIMPVAQRGSQDDAIRIEFV
ncbi:hypothetical protein HK102_008230, partial [Quaeritorhiza haematococci]